MNKNIPSSSGGQAQMGADSTSKADQPLSYHHRPDAGRRGPDPLDYQHRHASMAEYAKLLALRYDHSHPAVLLSPAPSHRRSFQL